MAYPVPRVAIGMQLWISDGASPETFFRYGRIGSVDGPNVVTDTVETTTHDTEELEEGYKEFEATLLDGGTFQFPLMFDALSEHHDDTATVEGTNGGGLFYLSKARVKRNMRFVLGNLSPQVRFSFKAIVVNWGGRFEVAGAQMANISLKISGKPTLELGDGDEGNV